MNAPSLKPWTQSEFLHWAARQEVPHEFDGLQPVAMTGGTVNHAIIVRNVHRCLDARLRGGRCQSLGPDAGVATAGAAIRYPDALVTCSKLDGEALTVPRPVVLFEVASPSSGRVDRIVKLREYAAIVSVRRYIILESTGVGLVAFHRRGPDEVWNAAALTGDDVLQMPEIGIEAPVSEFYEGVDFGPIPPATSQSAMPQVPN